MSKEKANPKVKENIKLLISNPDQLTNLADKMFDTADSTESGYLNYDDITRIFINLVEKLQLKPPTKEEVLAILK